MSRLSILSVSSVVLAAIVFLFDRPPTTVAPGNGFLVPKPWLTNRAPVLTPHELIRPPDQTFLTFPEWFLVFGPEEQANYFRHHTSTKFPFTVQIYQNWEGYHDVYKQIKGNFPFNTGYHVMIVVISASSTVEFGIKAAYETLIGRLTDPADGASLTDEDKFNADFAQDYVSFIKVSPWYDFDFKSRLGALWRETSLTGPHLIRKWERKYILTTELVVKMIYGWLIKIGTHSAYERPQLTTAVIVSQVPKSVESEFPDLKILKNVSDNDVLVLLRRYEAFKPEAIELAKNGAIFKEIAGNSSAILVSVLVHGDWKPTSTNACVLFMQTLPTAPGLHRLVFATPVSSLSEILNDLTRNQIEVEHIYDF